MDLLTEIGNRSSFLLPFVEYASSENEVNEDGDQYNEDDNDTEEVLNNLRVVRKHAEEKN